MNLRHLYCCVALLFLPLFVGCPDDSPTTGLVTGTVTLDGEPIENAQVNFYPSGGRASGAVTNAEGQYELMFHRKKGALIGTHKVTITTEIAEVTGSALLMASEEENARTGEADQPRRELLSRKYTDVKRTELTATVEAGNNVKDFDLKSGR